MIELREERHWLVDGSYPQELYPEPEDRIQNVLAGLPFDSGLGLGFRDYTVHCESEINAHYVKGRLKDKAPWSNLEVICDHSKSCQVTCGHCGTEQWVMVWINGDDVGVSDENCENCGRQLEDDQ